MSDNLNSPSNYEINDKRNCAIYNEKVPHLSNHMLTPNQMHKQSKLIMRTYNLYRLFRTSQTLNQGIIKLTLLLIGLLLSLFMNIKHEENFMMVLILGIFILASVYQLKKMKIKL